MKKPLIELRQQNNLQPAQEAEQFFDMAVQHMRNALDGNTDADDKRTGLMLAAEYFLAAANHGHKLAQMEFGLMCLNGMGVNKNYIMALEWLEQSAVDHRDNTLWLAETYLNGRCGILINPIRAAQLYKTLADGNDTQALYALARLHETGVGAERSNALARMLYVKAANDGHVDAQLKLAHFLDKGLGGEANSELAQQWRDKATQVSAPASSAD